MNLELNQLGREIRPSLALPAGPSTLKDDVLAFRVTEFAKSLPQWLPGPVAEETDPNDRLCPGRQW